jgi:flagellar hook-basal body complex protein FliE
MSFDAKHIQKAISSVSETGAKQLLKPGLVEEFNSVFKEAAAAAANVDTNDWSVQEKRKKEKAAESITLDRVDRSSVAQLSQDGVVQNAQKAKPKDLNIVPLQIFLDNAIRSLDKVSKQERRMNDLMDGFIKGDVSEDTVVLETAKLNLSISMVTTIVQSAVTTFKEIQNIPV